MRSDPVMTSDGILVGQGGGNAGWYHDFEFLADGSPIKLVSVGGGDSASCRLPWGASRQVLEWTRELLDSNFFNIPQPPLESDYIFYLGLAVSKRVPHFLYWADAAHIPSAILTTNVRIRQWLAMQFLGTFGTGARE